jgi:precorrin-6B methylase 1
MLKSYRDRFHLIVMSDVEQDLAQTAAFLLENGLSPTTTVVVGEELGSINEKIITTQLSTVASRCYHWISMMVVKSPGT